MPDAPTPQEIEALLARVPEGYTPGPWHAEDTNGPLGTNGRRAPIGIWAQVLFDAALSLEDPDVDPQDEAWICGTHCRTGDADDANAGLMALAPEIVTALRALAAENARLRDEMLTAIAHMANVQIDIDLGVPIATTQATLASGLAKARAALNPTGDDNGR